MPVFLVVGKIMSGQIQIDLRYQNTGLFPFPFILLFHEILKNI